MAESVRMYISLCKDAMFLHDLVYVLFGDLTIPMSLMFLIFFLFISSSTTPLYVSNGNHCR